MEVLESIKSVREVVVQAQSKGLKIGLTPTMGALHEGHVSLVSRSVQENEISVCSIFVNPTQFNNSDDFKHYPKTLDNDLKMLKNAGCDYVFVPSVREMYPEGQVSKSYDFGGIEVAMEGKFRPGHFDGVGTIVSRLFDIVTPDRAYFGEKDYQQLLIIKKLAEICNYPISIVGCDILRESSGVAMSPRNLRLSKSEFNQASFVYEQLTLAKNLYTTHSLEEINTIVKGNFMNHPVIELEYFVIADSVTMNELVQKGDFLVRAFVSAFIGEVRLIDNMALN